MNYQFDMNVAVEYGDREAIFIKNFQFWIIKNKANEKHAHDDRTWTYNSIKSFAAIFPCYTEKQIRRILESLISQGVLITGNYNQKGYDQTTWYAFKDEKKWIEPFISLSCPKRQMELPKWSNGIAQMGEPIPDNKLHIENTDRNNKPSSTEFDGSFNEFYSAYPKKVGKEPALKSWKKIKPALYEMIIADVKNRAANHIGWQDKQYVPNPATYLNQKRWEDEINHIRRQQTNNVHPITQPKRHFMEGAHFAKII
jgi:hypothetical protein